MKIFTLILSFNILIFSPSKSQQNYVIFSDDFICHQHEGGFIVYDSWYFFLNNEDTVINNLYYKKLYEYTYIIDKGDTSLYCCYYVREDTINKLVFFYNSYKNEEILLYDFGLSISDSVYIKNRDSFPSFGFNDFFFLYKIDSVYYKDKFYKKYLLRTHPEASSDTTFFYWIEKIGAPQGGLFHYFNSHSPISEFPYSTLGVYRYNKNIWCRDSTKDCPTSPPDTLLELISNHITGFVYEDKNKNCLMDLGEPGLPDKIVEIQPGDYFTKTDSAGFFRLGVGKDSFTVSLQDTNSLWMNKCHNDSLSYQITFNSYRNNSGPFYFGMDSIFVNTKNQTFMDEKFIFYPNPSTGKINLVCKANYSQSLSVKIHNLIGISVHSFSTNSSPTTVTLDVSALSNGIYFAEVKTGNGNPLRYKFILSR